MNQKENIYQEAFNNSADAIVYADYKTGEIVDCNIKAEQLFERTRLEMIGQSQKILHPAPINEKYKILFKRHIIHQKGLPSIIRILTKSGQEKEVIVYAVITKIKDRKIVQGFFKLLDDKPKSINDLMAIIEKYRDTFLDSISPTYIFDKEYNLIDVNESGLNLLGYKRDQLLKLSLNDIVVTTDELEQKYNLLKSGEKLVNYEHKLINSNGEKKIVYNNSRPITDTLGNIVGIVSVLIDITREKKSFKLLNITKEKYRTLLENILDWVWEVNSKGEFVYSSPRVYDLLGYKPEEIIGKTPFDLMLAEEVSHIKEYIAEKVKNKENIVRLQNINIHKNGKKVILEVNGIPILDKNGNVTGYRGIDRDITQQKDLEHQLINSEKLSTVGLLASGVAHEFNNILTMIDLSCKLPLIKHLENKLDLPDDIINKFIEIKRYTRRAEKIVSNLMTFSKPANPRKEFYEINKIIDRVIKFQKNQLSLENIRIKKNYHSESKMYIDISQIEQVFLNLLINSRHAILPNGEGTIEITVEIIDDFLKVTFKDDGIGIDKVDQEKIFIPFFTTKGALSDDNLEIKGTGLGLSVSYQIIKNHNGKIDFKSEKNIGTEFYIFLPLVNENDVVSSVKYQKSDYGMKYKEKLNKNINILIVDDEKDITDLIRDMFESADFKNVIIENSGIDAIDRVKKQKIDIVFLDMLLPNMKGTEIAKKIKELNPEIEIVFVTGKILTQDDKTDLKNYKVLKKPFRLKDIFRIINEIYNSKSD